jgi:hypothetical protein
VIAIPLDAKTHVTGIGVVEIVCILLRIKFHSNLSVSFLLDNCLFQMHHGDPNLFMIFYNGQMM